MAELWLAFDIGTTGTKCALLASDGRTNRSTYRAYDTSSAEGGLVEQRADSWWTAVVEGAQELDLGEATAIAITGQMQDVILIDAHGNPVRPVILYSDTRARKESEEINQRTGADRLRQLTGNTQDAASLLAKLLWIARHEPENLARSKWLLVGAADYVAFKLTGMSNTDTTTASTTGLLDIRSRTMHPPELFSEIGLAGVLPLLPEVRSGGSLIGKLEPAAAQLLGVRSGIPVYHGPGDAGATTLGVGSGEAGQVYAYVGTSGWVAFTSSESIPQDTGIITLAHPNPAKYIYIAPLLTAGGNLDWARNLFAIEDHTAMIAEAMERRPTGLLYLPYLNGERSPFSDPFARGALIGLNPRHTRADVCRAVLEGVAYAYRHALEALIPEAVSGLALTGGGTRSRLWCQLFADITRVPVTIAEDAANVGLRGALLAAQVAAGQYADYAPKGHFSSAVLLRPDGTFSEQYERQYPLFRAAYEALKPIFAGMG